MVTRCIRLLISRAGRGLDYMVGIPLVAAPRRARGEI
jgi:hypothetical protein